MRNHRVERACAVRVGGQDHGWLDQQEHDAQEDRQARRARQGHRKAIALEQGSQSTRPGVLPVRLHPDVREHLGKIHLEFVRRRVLAGVIARAAVVTEIGEVREVAFGEAQAALERWKDCAEAFAIPAGVADARHALTLFDQRDG